MLVWQLTKPKHAPGLNGEGSRIWGGRWNSVGTPVVYVASSLALAALEYLVHMQSELRRKGRLPHLIAVGVTLPDDLATPLNMGSLPASHGIPDCQAAGDAWFKAGKSLGLIVPSHVIPGENNLILNPVHPDMAQVAVRVSEAFGFDDRLGT